MFANRNLAAILLCLKVSKAADRESKNIDLSDLIDNPSIRKDNLRLVVSSAYTKVMH